MLFLINRGKQLKTVFPASNGPMVSPCYFIFPTVTQIYYSKVTPIAALHPDKIAEAALLYVFIIVFPAYLFMDNLVILSEYNFLN